MIQQPERWVERYYEAGSDAITIHAEAVDDPAPVLEQISQLGAAAGLAVNPDTPISKIESCVGQCDLVLVMSVEPGFGGQKFNPIALDKIKELRSLCGDRVLIEIDGGINQTTIQACADAGAELFVAGSAVFSGDDYGERVEVLAAEAALPL